MRIANLHSSGGVGYYVHRAQANAAQNVGIEWLNWDGSDEQLEEFQPDMIITDVGRKDIVPPNDVSTAMIVSQWTDDPIWPELANRYMTSAADLIHADKVEPDMLYHHCTPAGIDRGFKFWGKRFGKRVHSVPLFADFDYFWRPLNPDPKIDISYVGGKWPYKSKVMDQYLLPVLRSFDHEVYGNRGWVDVDGVNYKGKCPEDEEANLYNNTKVVPCCHEPHSHHGYDIVLRAFTPFLAGAMVVSDPNPSIYGECYLSKDSILVAKDREEYICMVEAMLHDDEERARRIKNAREEILAKGLTMEYNLQLMLEGMYEETGDHKFSVKAIQIKRFLEERYIRYREV